MERPRIAGYDCYTGEHINREMTEEEFAEYQAANANAKPLTADE